jgi:PTH1 family peptidyl-tRNA hydrolase
VNQGAANHFVAVGLGNPGKRYEYTRHNVGALIVEAWATARGWPLKAEKRFCAHVARGNAAGKNVHLLLPMTYMNDSGRAVRGYLDFFRLQPAALLVVSDEVALPFGQLRLRGKGSAGGHNGLRSIEQHIGTQEFARLRVGVGPAPAAIDLADYVLGLFRPEEFEALPSLVKRGVDALEALLQEPMATVANRFNG